MADRDDMVRRQRVLAEFGGTALRSEDAQEVLTEACRLVADALGVDFAKVLQIDHDAHEALVRAGVGWGPEVVGQVRLPLGDRSSEAHAIRTAEPLISRNIAEEDRFDFPEFMRRHGVVAMVNVPIFVPGGEPYGLLQVDSREPRDFDEEDIAFLKTYATILGPVIDRLHKVDELKAERDRNAMLLRELQHRVKNDLAVVQSLIRLRSKGASDEVREELRILGERIETLSLLHDQLHANGAVDRLPLRPYVEGLLENLSALHRGQAGPVALEVDVAELEASPGVAGSVGLIVNEFTTNSFKHAFNGQGGVLALTLRPADEGKAVLRLADNGAGFEGEVPPAGGGSGLTLIEGLARQLGAEPRWTSEGGVRLELEFGLE